MRYVSVGRVAGAVLTLLFLLSVCPTSSGAEEQVITAKVIGLIGTVNVTKADGTTEALTDTSKPIMLPATIEMAGKKGTFWISLPSTITGKSNTLCWSMRSGETVRVSVLENGRGVRFEYPKGTRAFYLDATNRENVLLVRAMTGTTTVVVLQNKVTVPEKDVAILTCPMNTLASVTVVPGQASEIEFSYSAEDEFTEVVDIVSEAGTVRVVGTGKAAGQRMPGPVIDPTTIPPSERLVIPVPTPEVIEESPIFPPR
jgi:hypothetical protein